MEKYILNPKHIHLIKPGEDTLFLHTDSLQLYPVEDDEILNFLIDFKEKGTACLGDDEEYPSIFKFISDTIADGPKTAIVKGFRKDQVDFSTIVLPISASCTLSCPYCFAQTDEGFRFEDYTIESIAKIVDFVMKQNEGNEKLITFVFFGGEPLLKVDIMKYTINYCATHYSSRKVNYSITTNGTVLSDNIIDFLKEHNIAIMLSMDGPDNEFNLRRFKNGESSVPLLMENIEKLRERGVIPQIRATLVNENPYICETYSFFEDMKIPFNIAFSYVSENKNHTYDRYDEPILQSIREQMDKLQDYYVEKIKKREPIYNMLFNELTQVLRFRIRKSIACSAGINYFTITSDGNIFSCAHMMNDEKYRIGTIETGIEDRTDYSPVSVEEIADCQSCWAQHLCMGGCFAQKISSGKSNNSAKRENECELERIIWEFYIRFFHNVMKYSPGYFDKKDC